MRVVFLYGLPGLVTQATVAYRPNEWWDELLLITCSELLSLLSVANVTIIFVTLTLNLKSVFISLQLARVRDVLQHAQGCFFMLVCRFHWLGWPK
jgi:hypothetical protein